MIYFAALIIMINVVFCFAISLVPYSDIASLNPDNIDIDEYHEMLIKKIEALK